MPLITVEVQHFEKREEGPKLVFAVGVGESVIAVAKRQIQNSLGVDVESSSRSSSSISLCCYEYGNRNRILLTSDEQFANLNLSSHILYYWIDDTSNNQTAPLPVSTTTATTTPDNMQISELKQRVAELEKSQEHLRLLLERNQQEIQQLHHNESVRREKWAVFLSQEVMGSGVDVAASCFTSAMLLPPPQQPLQTPSAVMLMPAARPTQVTPVRQELDQGGLQTYRF